MNPPSIDESARPAPRPPDAPAPQAPAPPSAEQHSSFDPRVQEWYEDNPLRRWRFAHHSDARELEDAAEVPRGSLESWETGGGGPDARQMRRLVRATGLRDLAAHWAAWAAARPAAPHIRARCPHGADGGLAQLPQSPSTWMRYPWAMLAELVDEEIHRAQEIEREFSLVMIQPNHGELAAWDGPAEACALRAVAAILESALQPADRLMSDDTGRFVILLPRMSKPDAAAVARRAVERLKQDPVSTRLFGPGHLDWFAEALSYPEDGVSAATLVRCLRRAVEEPSREPNRQPRASQEG